MLNLHSPDGNESAIRHAIEHMPMELSKSKLGIYSSLGSKKMRLRHGLFLVEGEKAVADTLGHYPLEALVVRDGAESESASSPEASGRVLTAGEAAMRKISTLSTAPDVLAVYRLPEPQSLPDPLPDDLYLILDGVQDPGNLGTIIRTAHWFGVRTVIASPDTADVFNPKTIQATMGSLPKVRVVYMDPAEVIAANPGMPVFGLLLDGKNIYDARLSGRGFIIMGNEGRGIRPALRPLITDPLLIPPYDPSDHSESLNVAIATAVTLSCFRR